MPTTATYALPLVGVLAEVPAAASGVCSVCHGCPNPGYKTCWSCSHVMAQVSRPCSLVVPVSLYEIPSQLYSDLRDYKRSTLPAVRDQSSLRVICVLCQFLSHHRQCIAAVAGGDWDLITNVPSTKGTPGPHALVSALGRVPSYLSEYEDLLVRGTASIGHLEASDNGYKVRRPLAGERVLIIDDTYTSGARAQSAASALALAGAAVVAIVPIGRVFQPGFSTTTTAFWTARQSQPFTFDVCCVH